MDERNGAKISKTVQAWIDEKSRVKGINQTQASIDLYELVLSDELSIIDPNPPTTLLNFLFSFYSAWFWLVIMGLSLMSLSIYVFPQSPPFSWLRVALGFLTSLYLPGYVFIESLYPKRDELEELERFGLSIGLSIALTPLAGFVLNYTPWGIRLVPITVALTLLTSLLGLVGVVRKYQYHILSLELREKDG